MHEHAGGMVLDVGAARPMSEDPTGSRTPSSTSRSSLHYSATTAGQWERIIRKEFAHAELGGIVEDFSGDIDVLTLPGGIWLGDLSSGTFHVLHDPKGRFTPSRDDLMIVMHISGATGQLRHRGRQVPVVKGGAVSVDLEKPYHFGYSSSLDQTILKLPRHLVSDTCFENAGVAREMSATSSMRLLSVLLHEIREVGEALDRGQLESASVAPLRHELETLSHSLRDLVSFAFGGDRRIDLRTDPRAQVQLAKDFIEANYWDPRMRLEDVAGTLRVSTRRLSKVFEAAGMSPAAYLREVRLDRAAQLMASTDHRSTVSDIAYRVGFGDISTFGRAFKKRFGETPAEYRAARQD